MNKSDEASSECSCLCVLGILKAPRLTKKIAKEDNVIRDEDN